TYSPEFALVDHSSPFEINNFPTSTTDVPGSLGPAYVNQQATSFGETQFTSQYPQYGSEEALYPPLSNFGTGSPASSSLSCSVSPQTLSGAFSPQQNSLAVNYAALRHVNNSTFDVSTLDTQFGSMMNIDNDRTPDLANMSLAVNSRPSSRLAASMTQHGSSMMALNTTVPPRGIGNPVSSSNLAMQNSINTQVSPVSQQWSSAVSGSPSGISSPGAHSHNSRMVSPTVRIEYCSRDDSPRRSRMERNPSNRSHG